LCHCYAPADILSSQIAEDTLEQEREKIRELHQQQQDSLKSLHELEDKFSRFTSTDKETLQDPDVRSRGATLELMSQAPPQEGPPPKPMDNQTQLNVFPNNFYALDQVIPNSDESTTDKKDEHISLEELEKAAEHVQELLKHITQLQKSFHVTKKTESHDKKRIDEVYRDFCRKWEEDIALPSANSSRPNSSLPYAQTRHNLPFESFAEPVTVSGGSYAIETKSHGAMAPENSSKDHSKISATYRCHAPIPDIKIQERVDVSPQAEATQTRGKSGSSASGLPT
jgi:hypothetical protein